MANDKDNQPTPTLEDALKQREDEINKILDQNPDMKPPEDAKWWAASTKLGFDTENKLDEETRQKLDDALRKAFDSNFDPKVTKSALEEAKGYLSGHDDILKQYEAIFSALDDGAIDSFRNIIQPDQKQN